MAEPPQTVWFERPVLQRLLDALAAREFQTLGPTLREGSVVLEPVSRVEDLPIGWRDEQRPGRYRVEATGTERIFDVLHGAGGLKRLTFAPRETLLQIETEGIGRPFVARPTLPEPAKLAVLGVRACDLAALRIQDRIFLHDRYPDPYYASRRSGLLLIAVNCTRSVSTCFCTSMGSGPEARVGFDLALTELDRGFVARSGSAAGRDLLGALPVDAAPAERLLEERRALDACAAGVTRRLETGDLPDLLYDNLDHPRWDDVAERCLSCANCTMVCPTCFCHDERDEPSLDGAEALRVREWDSCFSRDHAQIHGMNFRPHTRERYRQWLVHKLASWIDQFGSSGCTGCGRCITWCPVGIDLTEEVAAIRGGEAGGEGSARRGAGT